MAFAESRAGTQALSRYVVIWRASRIFRNTDALWTAAIMTPIDCNVKAFEDFTLALGPLAPHLELKLRLIAHPECLLKFVEGVLLKEGAHQTSPYLLPHQIGCGIAAAWQLAVAVFQSCAQDATVDAMLDPSSPPPRVSLEEAHLRHLQALDFVSKSVDESNAHSAGFRRRALKAARSAILRLAGSLVVEW